jgi:hypothetical protein
MDELVEKEAKEKRRPPVYYVVMNEGQIHSARGRVTLNRILAKLDPAKVKLIVRGHECKIIEKKTLSIQV